MKILEVFPAGVLSSWPEVREQFVAVWADRLKRGEGIPPGGAVVAAAPPDVLAHLEDLRGAIPESVAIEATEDDPGTLLRQALPERVPDEEFWAVRDARFPRISAATLLELVESAGKRNGPVFGLRGIPYKRHPASVVYRRWKIHANLSFSPNPGVAPGAELSCTLGEGNGMNLRAGRGYALWIRGFSETSQVVGGSQLWEWTQSADAREGPLEMHAFGAIDETGSGGEGARESVPIPLEVQRSSGLTIRWRSVEGAKLYKIAVLSEEPGPGPYLLIPLVVGDICWFDSSRHVMVRKDTNRPIRGRQDVPDLFERVGWVCAGRAAELRSLDRSHGPSWGSGLVVPAAESLAVETALDYARWRALEEAAPLEGQAVRR